jgi:O-antigen/teichoic acid export membrane protein
MGILSICLFIAAPYASAFLFDQYSQEGVIILRILSGMPLATSISNVFAVQGLYSFGKHKLVANILLTVGLLHLPVVYLAIQHWSGIGAASALIFTEFLVALSALYAYRWSINQTLNAKL